jgi:hypothetical protein
MKQSETKPASTSGGCCEIIWIKLYFIFFFENRFLRGSIVKHSTQYFFVVCFDDGQKEHFNKHFKFFSSFFWHCVPLLVFFLALNSANWV